MVIVSKEMIITIDQCFSEGETLQRPNNKLIVEQITIGHISVNPSSLDLAIFLQDKPKPGNLPSKIMVMKPYAEQSQLPMVYRFG